MVDLPQLWNGLSANVSERKVRSALHAGVLTRLQQVLQGLTIVYFLCSAIRFLLQSSDAGFLIARANLWTAVACFALWAVVRRYALPVRWAHALGSTAALVIVGDSLFQLDLLAEPQQTATVALVVLGAGSVFLSAGWLAFTLAVSFGAWGLTAWPVLPQAQFMILACGLLIATALSVAGHASRLRKQRQRCSALLEEERRKEVHELAILGANHGLWYWDLEADTIHFSPQWKSMLGYEPDEVGTSEEEWFGRVHPYYVAEVKEQLSAHLYAQTDQFESEYRMRRRDGGYLWVLGRGVAVRDEQGNPTAIAGSQTDITRLMEVEKRVLNDAFHDKLTSLPNRHFFMGQLETAVARSQQPGADPFAVIFLDLDRFKVINDSLGHLVGDQLLSAAAARLRACQRPGDTVARFGGDEFVILLEGLREPDDVLHIGAKIQQALVEPFKLGRHEVVTAASIGIALGGRGVKRPEDLLRNADIAMYYAKAQRKGQIQVFNEDMHTRAIRLWQLQNDLGRVLEREELRLHYQPIISLTSGRIIGVEALVRWQRTKSELLGPSEFIPLAEEMGIIVDIGEWALRNACAQNVAWQRAGLQPLRVAVNLSPRQLQKENFPETVRRVLAETHMSPDCLELELTETALMDSLDVAPATLDALSKSGIRVAIDDFGTGYSSMGHLRRFTFDTLKIDRSFVADITTDEKAAAVAKGMIGLAHNLKLKVTAEGVESAAQLRFLLSERCDQMQGFLASQPLEPDRIARIMRSNLSLQRLLQEPPSPEQVPTLETPVLVGRQHVFRSLVAPRQ